MPKDFLGKQPEGCDRHSTYAFFNCTFQVVMNRLAHPNQMPIGCKPGPWFWGVAVWIMNDWISHRNPHRPVQTFYALDGRLTGKGTQAQYQKDR